MRLKAYDGQYLRLTTKDGEIFDGLAYYSSAEYCETEFGCAEDALQIDDWLFYESQIQSVELRVPGGPELWLNRPQHRMKLQHAPFAMIESGQKRIELRLWDEKRRRIQCGDVIRFEDACDETEVLRVIVRSLDVFPSFGELYRALPLLECGYTPDTLANASPEDMNAYYSSEEQARWGVVGIGMELM